MQDEKIGNTAENSGTSSTHRQFRGWLGLISKLLLVGIPVSGILFLLDIPLLLGFTIWKAQYVGIFVALVLASIFLNVSPTKWADRRTVPWYDLVCAVISLAPGIYIAIFYPKLIQQGAVPTPEGIALGTITILLTLEALRRTFGWVIVILVCFFVVYTAYAGVFPGLLMGISTPWSRLLTYTYLDPGSFIYLTSIAGTLILAFLVFSMTILYFGGGKVLTDIALSLTGQFRGGPAKVAVIGSCLFGSLSGSSISNVMVTGSITIPLMKKIGYKSEIAGAIEAVASTGGMIMPPVMGIVAFVLADMIGVPYAKVAIAASVPAALYYFSLFVQIDLEAVKAGLRGLPRHELPRLTPILRKSWTVLIPLIALIYTLFVLRLYPATAALYSAFFSAFVIMPIVKENRVHFFRKLLGVLEESGRVLMDMGALLIGAGIITALIGISGLGTTISIVITQIAGGQLWLLLLIAAGSCIMLGMGMPIVPAYILVAVLVAPALVELGIPLLAAHLFILYYANLAAISPPIGLTFYVAAGLAQAKPMVTGYYSMRLAILAYIVPFLFILSPALLLADSLGHILDAVGTAILGTFATGITLTGYLSRKLSWSKRILLGLGAVALFVSLPVELIPVGIVLKLAGLLKIVPLVSYEWKQRA